MSFFYSFVLFNKVQIWLFSSLTKGYGPLFILIHWIPKMLNLSLVQNVTLQMLNWLKSRYVCYSFFKIPYSSITFNESMERLN